MRAGAAARAALGGLSRTAASAGGVVGSLGAACVGASIGSMGVAVGLGTAAGRTGVSLLGPATAAPLAGVRRLSPAVLSLLDPRPGRHQRRVAAEVDRVTVEVRGLSGPQGRELGALLERRLQAVDGLVWSHVNAVTGRLTVGLDPDRRTVADVLAVVRSAEQEAGTRQQAWSRHGDLPGDREPLVAAALALVGDVVGLAAAVAVRGLPVPPGTKICTAAVALVDAQPRLRRGLERHLGAARTDLVITLASAGAQAASRGGATLAVDAGQRAAALVELVATRRSWLRWERQLHGPGAISVSDPVLARSRPRPLPTGPIERFADHAASGSLVAAAAALLGQQSLSEAADALLVGVPKASRTSRESFASVLSARLCRQGALPLDAAVWRRLDRASAVVVDAAGLRGGASLVLDAVCSSPSWTREHVWSAGQRLAAPGSLDADGLVTAPAIPPPVGRRHDRLGLRPSPGRAAGGGAGWFDLLEDGLPVGMVLVGSELHPRADALLAAARRAGLRVVLAGDGHHGELRSRADAVEPAAASLTATVRQLQDDGHVVVLVSARSYRALAAADVGIGLATRTPSGRLHVPWTADVVFGDLAGAEQVVSATAAARAVSERGRTLSMSASALGALLLVAGPRRGAWNRAVSPITGGALMGLATGARAGWKAGRPLVSSPPPLLPWHALEADDVLRRLPPPSELRPVDGDAAAALPLSLRGAAGSLLELGRHVREELADPLTPVLTVGAAASAILGAPTDAALVGSVMGANALVSALQRQRADRAMRTLRAVERVGARRLVGPGARRLSGGVQAGSAIPTPAEHLQPGDVLALCAGDVVPADARLLVVDGLEVDESGLTGEAVTVDKQAASTPGAALGERACMVFDGSIVVAGRARAVVVAVGPDTQAGRALAAVPAGGGTGGVQAQLRALTDKALPLTLVGGAVVTGLSFLRRQPLRAAVADGVAVAVAAVPEGLPLVATVAQLAAARRLSRRGVLVRSSRTVEALGRVDTMCFDKTGTLTEGALRLVELADLGCGWSPAEAERSPDARRLLRAAARACPQPEDGPVVHATDRAVLDAAGAHLGRQAVHVWDPVEEVPFESNRGYAATLGQTRASLRLIVKGAPEVLLPRCTRALHPAAGADGRQVRPLSEADRVAAERVVHDLASRGLRVLVVARRELASAPADVEAAIEKLTLMGFVGIADTPRPSTLPVIAELARNGISVRMITGDHPVTARAIAEQLGISSRHVVTGAELDRLDETERAALVLRSTVFARVTPEHKVRIVQALQHAGAVVAMTGDGSNDAAAIRLADVGVGIAAHGSAAARNAADLVLTEPDLTLLLDALVEGRRMWQRVRDAVAVLVGGNAGEVVFTVFGTALSGRAPVTTRQFLLVNLLTDMFPAMAVALAHPRRSDVDRPPTAAAAGAAAVGAERARAGALGAELAATPTPELGRALLTSISIRGLATAGGAGGAWLLGRGTGTARRASTMGLVALVGTQLGQTLVLGGRSPLVWTTAALSGAVLIGIVQTPGVSQFFGCTPLDPAAWLVVAGSAGAATVGSVLVPRLVPLGRRVAPPAAGRLARSTGALARSTGALARSTGALARSTGDLAVRTGS